MDLNEQQVQRLAKVAALREQGSDPYPPRSQRSHTAAQALERFTRVEPTLSGDYDSEPVIVAGRVVAIRDMGKSVFAHVRDRSGTIQVYLRRSTPSSTTSTSATSLSSPGGCSGRAPVRSRLRSMHSGC